MAPFTTGNNPMISAVIFPDYVFLASQEKNTSVSMSLWQL